MRSTTLGATVAALVATSSITRAQTPPDAAGVVGGPIEPPARPPAPPPPAVPAADSPSIVDVKLKNGAVVHGRLVKLATGVEIVVEDEGTHARRTIPWEDFAQLRQAGATRVAPAAAAAPPSRASASADQVHVKLVADDPRAGVYAVADVPLDFDGVRGGKLVCAAPCDAEIDAPPEKLFFVGGPGLASSRRFEIAHHGAATTLHADTGTRGARTAGIVLLSVGGGVALTGASIALAGAALNDKPPTVVRGGTSKANGDGLVIAGAIAGGVGGLMAIVGGFTLGAGVTSVEIFDRRTGATRSYLPAVQGTF